MLRIAVVCAILILGTALSSFLAGIRKKGLIKWLNIPISTGLTLFIFLAGLYMYAKINYVAFSQTDFFPDRISLIVGGFMYLLTSAISGIIIGAVEAKSLSKYIKGVYFSNYFKPLTLIFLASTIAFAGIGIYTTYTAENVGLRISEVCAHNFNLVADANGKYPDYIELHNNGSEPVLLSNFYLSDDTDKRNKFQLPEVELAAGEYMIIWADGAPEALDASNQIHTNFNIADKEIITLSALKGTVLDSVNVGVTDYNVSLTLVDNQFVMAYGTPGKPNDNCVIYVPTTLTAPTLSLGSGFYTDDSITLEISAPRKSTIYYTTDGSTPTVNSTQYTSPITITDISSQENKYVSIKNTVANYDNVQIDPTPVDKATIIRAIAIDKNGNKSEIVCGTYFVGEAAKTYENHAVISIVSDPDDLFGDNGICVTGKEYDEWYNNTDRSEPEPLKNFTKHGKEWEREATIQFWDENGNFVLDQSCGIRVQGNASRGYAVKRFSFYARNAYSGSDYFENEIFEGVKTHSLYLRHDKYDIGIHEILDERENASVQHLIPVTIFVDGEFYCESYLREKYDKEYFSEYYNVPIDDLMLISDSEAENGGETALELHEEFLAFLASADASDPEVYAEICEKMDVQNFIDFICANLYFNNIDWSLHKNYMCWRTLSDSGDGYNDGKWRWCIYDMDAIGWCADNLGIPRTEVDPFVVNLPYVSSQFKDFLLTYAEAPIYSTLIKNDDFKRQLVLTYFDFINTYFTCDYAQPILEKLNIEDNPIWVGFFEKRPEFAINNIVNHLNLSGETANVTIDTSDTNGGRVTINTVTADYSEKAWSGIYPTDYSVTVTATPSEGWEFAGWEGDVESSDASLSVDLTEDGLDLKAIFVKTGGGN